ncbi:uncharacterized protein F4807DRAFT_468330 [Annulohypoxylon truncatum]|uniref:uncharacterized protein n=1 Tax=Annulohypoxylon truncatum TaxID=327061 RepID=UPI0020083194|nr:uncharacterized protein F4807DRAFT_468330 [Annulohypoxylon truncatum]KAI1214444.1 hypothetical protein F4807DRAFT_468330 [Annulohypoxylon truncatum]
MALSESTKDHFNRGTMLSDDILYYLANEHIQEPQVISRLSQTCRRLSNLLDPLLYRTDVLNTEQKLNESSSEFMFPWQDGAGRIYPYQNSADDWKQHFYPLKTAQKISALHWAAGHKDKSLGLAVARKSIEAALKHWPSYLGVYCQGDNEVMNSMAPIHLAAMSGNEEILQELIRASCVVDMRVYLDLDFESYGGDSTLSKTAWSYVARSSRHFMVVNPLGLAILYGHLHIAETLARVTQDLVEEVWVRGIDLISSLKMAVLHKMPSVVRILQSRGYKPRLGSEYFDDGGLLQLAAVNDGNEEMLQLLIESAKDAEEANTMGAFQSALGGRCKSNLLFLAKCPLPTSGPLLFFHFMSQFIQTDDYLPVVKQLLEDDPEMCRSISLDIEMHLRDNIGRDLYFGRGLMIQDYLLYHPNINFSDYLMDLLADQENRREHRERFKTLPKIQQEMLVILEQKSNAQHEQWDWRG